MTEKIPDGSLPVTEAGKALDYKSVIPAGSDLRAYLICDNITPGEIQAALRRKGIYIGTSDKEETVPLLSSTLLTPSDFDDLMDSHLDRELKQKQRTSFVPISELKDCWIETVENAVDGLSLDLFEEKGVIEFSQNPKVVVDDKTKIRIPCEIKRTSLKEDWHKREQNFSAEVVVELNGNALKAEIHTCHTSSETEKVANHILKEVVKALHADGIVKEKEPHQITFGAFSGAERVRFFKRLTAGMKNRLSLGEVAEMVIGRDIKMPDLPDDPFIAWMGDIVKKVTLDGERLNDVFLIAEEKYYNYYYIQSASIKYDFDYGDVKGSALIDYFFSPPVSEKIGFKEELTFAVSKIKLKGRHEEKERREGKAKVKSDILNLIATKFEQLLAERALREDAVRTS